MANAAAAATATAAATRHVQISPSDSRSAEGKRGRREDYRNARGGAADDAADGTEHIPDHPHEALEKQCFFRV